MTHHLPPLPPPIYPIYRSTPVAGAKLAVLFLALSAIAAVSLLHWTLGL